MDATKYRLVQLNDALHRRVKFQAFRDNQTITRVVEQLVQRSLEEDVNESGHDVQRQELIDVGIE